MIHHRARSPRTFTARGPVGDLARPGRPAFVTVAGIDKGRYLIEVGAVYPCRSAAGSGTTSPSPTPTAVGR